MDARQMIDAWLDQRGGPRRFTSGDSADFYAVQRWLIQYDYVLSTFQGSFFIRPRGGQPRRMKWPQVIDLVDTLRSATGLPTIRPART